LSPRAPSGAPPTIGKTLRRVDSQVKSMATIGVTRVLILSPHLKEVDPMHEAHLSALETKHMVLDRQITAENLRPLPDTRILADLKKQKLRLKEEIAAI
jgi:hypothetical protein